jgi:hypothetical protein
VLSKEDKAYVMERCGSGFFGRAEFLIDGYRVTLQRELISKDRLGLMTYVGGRFKSTWVVENSEEARRFFFLKSQCLLRGKGAQSLKKKIGKRSYEQFKDKCRYQYYTPVWSSVNAALSAFLTRNVSIELLRPGHPILEKEADGTLLGTKPSTDHG